MHHEEPLNVLLLHKNKICYTPITNYMICSKVHVHIQKQKLMQLTAPQLTKTNPTKAQNKQSFCTNQQRKYSPNNIILTCVCAGILQTTTLHFSVKSQNQKKQKKYSDPVSRSGAKSVTIKSTQWSYDIHVVHNSIPNSYNHNKIDQV